MFGLFTSKTNPDETARLPTPTPSVASVVHHSPLRLPTVLRAVLGGSTIELKDSVPATENVAGEDPVQPPPTTPSPPPAETKALHHLVQTIPPKTLHAYTLAHLHPRLQTDDAPRPPSPDTVAKLTTFFSTLVPPPLLHCVRCHKDFFDIENEEKDKACRVPHDDESALVSRVAGGTYETLWGCCGQTASGDGSQGPPDGWCYEGVHTTDIKRARFRADSTIHDDKLTSCLKLNCHGIRDQLPRRDVHASPLRNIETSSARKSNASPARSQASVLIPRSTRKRSHKSLKAGSGSENEAVTESSVGRAAKAKDKEKTARAAPTAIDEPSPLPKPKSKVKSRPTSRVRPPPSMSTATSLPVGSNTPPVVSIRARTMAKPKAASRTLLSQSHTHLASDSEASTRSRPRTRSQVREGSRARDVSRTRTTSRLSVSERPKRSGKATKRHSPSPTPEEEARTDEESEQERRGRKRRRVVRN